MRRDLFLFFLGIALTPTLRDTSKFLRENIISSWGIFLKYQNIFGSHSVALPQKRVLCGYAIDFDAVSGWIYTGTDEPPDLHDVSRGIWGGTVGTERMLKLLAKYNITATFFIPGHSLESFPRQAAMVRDAGHEIGLHGYSHELVSQLSRDEERAVMANSVELLTAFTGKYPRGWTAPSWSMSANTVEILEEFNIFYDHSFAHHDCQPYYLPHNPPYVQPKPTTTTTTMQAEEGARMQAADWMHPIPGSVQLSGIIEIPGNWQLDDWIPFTTAPGVGQGYVDPDSILRVWKAQFDFYYREYDSFIFPISVHPDVSGKAHVQVMHEAFIEYVNGFEGVEWVTLEQMAEEFKDKKLEGYTVVAGSDSWMDGSS